MRQEGALGIDKDAELAHVPLPGALEVGWQAGLPIYVGPCVTHDCNELHLLWEPRV